MKSVCIATYNGEKFIRQQLESILCQLDDDDEVVISDDGSIDATLDIVRALGDHRIRLFHHQKVKASFPLDYSTHNFENALCQAKGEYIFLADQDDVWLAGKVETMMKALEHADFALSDCKVTDEKLNILLESFFTVSHSRLGAIPNIIRCSYLGSCLAFRRCVLERALPFPQTMVGHDLWIGLIAYVYFRTVRVDKPLILFRRHEDCVTSSGFVSPYSFWFKISYRFVVVKSLFERIFSFKKRQ